MVDRGERVGSDSWMPVDMTFDEWLRYGEESGFCSGPVCQTHDGTPMHPSEEDAWERGEDPCCAVVRLGSMKEWEVPGEE